MTDSASPLAGIEAIEWDKLSHAYGAADDIPQLLKDLLSPGEPCQEAHLALFGNIYHQGTRYSASAAAVPFLIKLIARDETPRKDNLIFLLTLLAVGDHTVVFPEGVLVSRWKYDVEQMQLPEYREERQREIDSFLAEGPQDELARDLRKYKLFDRGDVQQGIDYQLIKLKTYGAVQDGLSALYPCLKNESPGVRSCAAFILGFFPEKVEESLPKLLEVVAQDQVETVRGTALISIALSHTQYKTSWKHASFEEAKAQLQSAFTAADQNVFARWCSAIGLIILGSENKETVSEAVRKISDSSFLAEYEASELEASQGFFPYTDTNLSAWVSSAICNVDVEKYPEVVRSIAGALKGSKGMETLDLAPAALRTAFSGVAPPEWPPFTELDEGQQLVIKGLAEVDDFNWMFANYMQILRYWRLPTTKEKLEKYISGQDDDRALQQVK